MYRLGLLLPLDLLGLLNLLSLLVLLDLLLLLVLLLPLGLLHLSLLLDPAPSTGWNRPAIWPSAASAPPPTAGGGSITGSPMPGGCISAI